MAGDNFVCPGHGDRDQGLMALANRRRKPQPLAILEESSFLRSAGEELDEFVRQHGRLGKIAAIYPRIAGLFRIRTGWRQDAVATFGLAINAGADLAIG